MQFKDAAYQILKQGDSPLHYNEITDRALAAGILTTTGQTPHSTMGALLYNDTLKENSRFRRGDEKGTFALQTAPPTDIQHQIAAINTRIRKSIRDRLLQMQPRMFENLIKSLLDEMGVQETSVTKYSGDGGIDVRGILDAENLSHISVAIQAKRWKFNVGPNIVRELRGSLKVHEHGIIITPSDYTASARIEAEESGKTPISLIDGEQLVEMLIEHQVGVKKEQYTVPVLDKEYWTDILGEGLDDKEIPVSDIKQPAKPPSAQIYPKQIQVKFKGQLIQAELINAKGMVRFKGKEYETPSAAAHAIASEWRSVNGWKFWKFLDKKSGKWKSISELRKGELENNGREYPEPIARELSTEPSKIRFPVQIRAYHKGMNIQAELLNINGKVNLGGRVFDTPTAAARSVATEWKSANGWVFWQFFDIDSGMWKNISELRKSHKQMI